MNRLAAVQAEPPLRSFATNGAGDGLVQVGVGEDDEGCVAAELHGRTDDGTGGVLEKDASDLGRPGERHLAHQWVVEQC